MKQCATCKYMYYLPYSKNPNTMYCGKSKAVNQYCSTVNTKDRCRKYEVEE